MLRRWLRFGRRSTGDEVERQPAGSAAPLDIEHASSGATAREAPASPETVAPSVTDPGGGAAHAVASVDDGSEAERRVRSLLASDAVSPATRLVLTARLDALARTPIAVGAVLTVEQVATLRAVIDRLVPQDDRIRRVDIVAAIDARLASGRTDGWRYGTLPPDVTAIGRGLTGLDEAAWLRHALDFTDLTSSRQDALLRLVQNGTVPGETWRTLPPRLWFEELLAEACEIFYADPLAQDEIGYVGYADLPGWDAIGLDQHDARELPTTPAGPISIQGSTRV